MTRWLLIVWLYAAGAINSYHVAHYTIDEIGHALLWPIYTAAFWLMGLMFYLTGGV